MKILDRYLLRQFLWPFCFSLLSFLLLYWIIDLFSHLDEFLKNRAGLWTLLQYYLASIPIVLVQTSPLASVTATIISLGHLTRTHELTAMRSSGLSWWRIAAPFLVIGILISLSAYFLSDHLIPQAMMVTHSIREENFEKKQMEEQPVIENVALYGTKDRMFYAKRYDPNDKILYDLIIFIEDIHHRPVAKIISEKAEWIVNDKWKLYSCVSYQLGAEGEILDKPIYYDERTMDLDETPQSFLKMEYQIHFMRTEQLEKYIERIAMSGQNITRRLLVELYSRSALPFTNIALMVLGIPFGILSSQQRKRFLTGMGLCVMIGISFYLLNSILMSLGNAGFLTPWVGAWGANLIFTSGGIFLAKKL